MTMNERSKPEREQAASNVRPFVPRPTETAARIKAGSPLSGARPLPRGRNAPDDDDDPGPTAA